MGLDKKDEQSIIIPIEVVSLEEKVKRKIKEVADDEEKNYGYNYLYLNVFGDKNTTSANTKIKGLAEGKYSEHTVRDSSTKDEETTAGYEIVGYGNEAKNSNWKETYGFTDEAWTEFCEFTQEKWTDFLKDEFPKHAYRRQMSIMRKSTSSPETEIRNYYFYFLKDGSYLMYTYRTATLINSSGEKVMTLEEANEFAKDFYDDQKEIEDHVTTSMKMTMKVISKDEGSDRKEGNFNDIFDDITYYVPTDSTAGDDEIVEKAGTVLGIITSIGMVIAVLMSAILGLKYMLGSVEEKADYKKGMIPYLVGAFLIFGICTIVKVMQQFGQSINNI